MIQANTPDLLSGLTYTSAPVGLYEKNELEQNRTDLGRWSAFNNQSNYNPTQTTLWVMSK